MRILGVDCGRVILNPYFGSIPDAFGILREIARSGQFEKIYVVSYVRPIGRIYFPLRLRLSNFWNYTGIPESNLYLCRSRQEKSVICDKLGITDFIDDNPEVLSYMKNVERLYAFNPRKRDNDARYPLSENTMLVPSWNELLPRLLAR